MTVTAQRPIQRTRGGNPIEHGSVRGYSRGCRCESCIEAARAYRHRIRPIQHGTSMAYVRSGCRCQFCVAAYESTHTPTGQKKRGLKRCFLPIEPLETAVQRRGMTLWNFTKSSGTTIARWRVEGVPLMRADTICCRMGLHLSEVYGTLWETA